MAKRAADVQLTQDNPGGNDNGSWGAASGPPKATAAQLANRRIAQPRGGRRPAASGVRRPAPSSPAVSNQQQGSIFGSINGTQHTQSSGGFSFGQAQIPSASASFPPFGNSNNTGNSSIFTPPSSSFSFGSQLSSNPFAPPATFGNSNLNEESTAQIKYSPSNNLFLQNSEVIQADAVSAGSSSSVAAPHLGGSSQPQLNPTTIINWSPQTSPAPSQPQQEPAPVLNWSQKTDPASSQTQQVPALVFNFGPPTLPASTQSEQNSTPAFAIGQQDTTTQGQVPSDSDVMMDSPEKKPLGRSLFDRVEQPPSYASSPATTTTTSAPSSIFSFTQNAPSSGGLFNNKNSTVTSSQNNNVFLGQGDLSSGVTTPIPALFGQKINNEASQSSIAPQPSIIAPQASSIALEPSNIAPQPLSIAPEPLNIAPQPFSIAREPSSPTKKGRLMAEPKKYVEDKPTQASPFTGLFVPKEQTANEQPKPVGRKRGEPPDPPEHWTTEEKTQYAIAWRLKQLDVGAEAKMKALIAEKDTRRIELLKQFYRQSVKNIMEAGSGPVKPVSPSLRVRNSEHVEIDSASSPISRRSHKRVSDSESSDPEESSKRPHNDQSNHYLESAAPASAVKRKADGPVDRQHDQEPSETSKRARVAEQGQVSYPSLKTTEPKSNTSSMFQSILEKPAALTNGEPHPKSSPSSFKVAESAPSSAVPSSKNKDTTSQSTQNPFAALSAKRDVVTNDVAAEPTELPQVKASIAAPAKPPPSLFSFKPVTPSNGIPASIVAPAKPPPSPFLFKPLTPSNGMPGASNSAVAKPPSFGNSGGSTNFLAQFGATAAADSKKEMEKRKAEDMDSDEDEAEWERRDAEEQRTKKQKMEQETSQLKPKYVPGKGFVFETAGGQGDNTWKPESPIKFGAKADTPVSVLHVNELDKQHEEHAKRQAAAANLANPFAKFTKQDSGNEGSKNGDATEEEQAPEKPIGGSLFDRISTPSSKANDDADKEHPLKASSQGINIFGHVSGAAASVSGSNAMHRTASPALTSLFPPLANTNGASRSTSPGATTGESATESNADGEDEGVEKHEQLDLTSGGPGEEDEDVLYEVRAKAKTWDDNQENEEEEKTGGWETRGLGQFRILKNRKTGKGRMLMRSDPAGRIVINSSLVKQFTYLAVSKSSCRVPIASSGQGIETWVINVGKGADAADIARLLEELKEEK